MSTTTASDIVVTITAAGMAAMSNNVPDRNGFKIEIHQAKVYDNNGVIRGTYQTTGYRLTDGSVRISVMIGANEASTNFDLHRIDLLDKQSGVVFARIRREDNSVIDRIFGKKKTALNYYLKLGLIDDDYITITVSGDDETAIALKYLDEHIADRDAHSTPATITATTENKILGGEHTHEIDHSTTTRKGIIETATVAEALAGTDEERAVTPKGLKAAIDQIPQVSEATTTQLGVVRLATAQDIANGTPNKVVTAELLDQAISESGMDIDNAIVTITNSSTVKGTIKFTPPFACRKIVIRGYVNTVRGNIEHQCRYTFELKNAGGTRVAQYTRLLSGDRSGGSGHGYYHNWHVPVDHLVKATFVAGQEYTITVTASTTVSSFNLQEEDSFVYVEYYK